MDAEPTDAKARDSIGPRGYTFRVVTASVLAVCAALLSLWFAWTFFRVMSHRWVPYAVVVAVLALSLVVLWRSSGPRVIGLCGAVLGLLAGLWGVFFFESYDGSSLAFLVASTLYLWGCRKAFLRRWAWTGGASLWAIGWTVAITQLPGPVPVSAWVEALAPAALLVAAAFIVPLRMTIDRVEAAFE